MKISVVRVFCVPINNYRFLKQEKMSLKLAEEDVKNLRYQCRARIVIPIMITVIGSAVGFMFSYDTSSYSIVIIAVLSSIFLSIPCCQFNG